MQPDSLNSLSLSTKMTTDQQRSQPCGVICPRCDCRHSYVIYTRHRQEHILRLRECRACGRRWTTRER
jgi:DNA-directed RNA polymerase subunit M/transcription elongation factor TFIIS